MENKELIEEYIKGNLGKEAAAEVADLLTQNEELRNTYHKLKRNYAVSGTSDSITPRYVSYLYNEIQHNIADTPNGRIRKIATHLSKYAAVLLVGLVAGWFIFSLSQNGNRKEAGYRIYETGPGQSSMVTFSDGSVIQLNSNSRLKIANNFDAKNKREVELRGEGFFNIAHNKEKPFSVMTQKGIVKVLGTRFNVEAYENEDFVTTLVTGKVELQNLSGELIKVLKPGQQTTVDVKNKLHVKTLNALSYSSWKEGYLTFEHAKLGEVILKIERFYNVEIHLNNAELSEHEINGKAFRHVEVEKLLEVLKTTYGIEYAVEMTANNTKIIHLN